jgi:glycosyltransferase involved in cell wall biosynthesis
VSVRVAHLVSHPVPYFAPLYRELSAREDIDLTVYFYSVATAGAYADPGFGRTLEWDGDLLDGYEVRVSPSARRTALADVPRTLDSAVLRDLHRNRYDVVWAHGYAHATTWGAAAVARATGSAFALREEQTLLEQRALPKRLAKRGALPALLRRAYGLYIGSNNREWFLHYGASASRLYATPYCVDNDGLRVRATELAPRRDALRARFGIDGDAPLIVFCGKLVEKKDPLGLLSAFARLRSEHRCSLLLVGDGPLRAELEVAARGIPDVRFAGFLNTTETPLAYAAADVFVLPSAHDETWGLVVNEAMNFGLPVVLTRKVGSAPDLVSGNGFVVPERDVDALASALGALVADPTLRADFGARSLELVGRHSIAACAGGIASACAAAASRSPVAVAA